MSDFVELTENRGGLILKLILSFTASDWLTN